MYLEMKSFLKAQEYKNIKGDSSWTFYSKSVLRNVNLKLVWESNKYQINLFYACHKKLMAFNFIWKPFNWGFKKRLRRWTVWDWELIDHFYGLVIRKLIWTDNLPKCYMEGTSLCRKRLPLLFSSDQRRCVVLFVCLAPRTILERLPSIRRQLSPAAWQLTESDHFHLLPLRALKQM